MLKTKILNLKKRNQKELRFKLYGKASIAFALIFLIILFVMIFSKSFGAFTRTKIALDIDLREQKIISQIDFHQLIKNSLKAQFHETKELGEINSLYQIVSKISHIEARKALENNPMMLGKISTIWISASSKVDMLIKHKKLSNLNKKQIEWITFLQENHRIKTFFNWDFFKYGDSREPEIAGIGASFVGSLMVILIFLILAFPIAVMCAFYLEEFAPKNRITDLIEISINNLAAIPSIIYGLLGLIIYLQFFNLPRSSSLVGGLTLFMLVLPIIIITTRNTIRSIPSSIRDGASALGASKLQIVLHHLLPLSIPGIMTGTILAISRAIGETAPLLLIGMIAFIADVPQSFYDPASVLPVQIYLWSDSPELGFAEKTAGAILILLLFLVLLNLSAIIIRKKFERKW